MNYLVRKIVTTVPKHCSLADVRSRHVAEDSEAGGNYDCGACEPNCEMLLAEHFSPYERSIENRSAFDCKDHCDVSGSHRLELRETISDCQYCDSANQQERRCVFLCKYPTERAPLPEK